MSFVAIAAVVAAGATAYGTYSTVQARNQAEDNAKSIYGSKPKIAPFVPLNLEEEQHKALQSNIDNAGSIMDLLEKIIPGYSNIVKEGLTSTESMVRGELPQDVIDQITRSDAFKSIQGGYGGTQMAGARTARDLGLTSLDLMEKGGNAAQLWSKLATGAVEPYTITTQDEIAAAAANNAGKQATDQYSANVAAAPDPRAAGLFNLDLATNQQTSQSLTSLTSILQGLGRQNYLNTANDIKPSGGAYIYDAASGTYKFSTGGG